MNLRRSRKQILFWLLRRRKRYQIQGSSMLPCLVHGETVLINPKYRKLKEKDIIVFHHPLQNMNAVKRIYKIHTDGRLEVLGDHPPESTDSRHFGFVEPNSVIGKVVSRFP